VVLRNRELALRTSWIPVAQVHDFKRLIEREKWYGPVGGLVPIYYGLEALPWRKAKREAVQGGAGALRWTACVT
jgi:hypothetical protein